MPQALPPACLEVEQESERLNLVLAAVESAERRVVLREWGWRYQRWARWEELRLLDHAVVERDGWGYPC